MPSLLDDRAARVHGHKISRSLHSHHDPSDLHHTDEREQPIVSAVVDQVHSYPAFGRSSQQLRNSNNHPARSPTPTGSQSALGRQTTVAFNHIFPSTIGGCGTDTESQRTRIISRSTRCPPPPPFDCPTAKHSPSSLFSPASSSRAMSSTRTTSLPSQ